MDNKRKPLRLQNYDYSRNGGYFITICTDKRRKLLCDISVGEGLCPLPRIVLSTIGNEVKKSIEYINNRYTHIKIDKYVIMPNHIHMIIIIDNPAGGHGNPPLRTVVAQLKSFTTHKFGKTLWQRSYYDHIIRDYNDYVDKWNYIDTNPARWAYDEYY